jgi:hypothetical protein
VVEPAACAPVTATIVVALITLICVHATPPIVTVAPVAKPVPVIVTGVAPATLPEAGAIADTVAAARTADGASASHSTASAHARRHEASEPLHPARPCHAGRHPLRAIGASNIGSPGRKL